MTKEEWEDTCKDITNRMLDHIKHFVTPVSKVIDRDFGDLAGSGSFFLRDGHVHLITNKHVYDEMQPYPLAVQFRGSGDVIQCTDKIILTDYPVDVATTAIPGNAWMREGNTSSAIPEARFAYSHSPVEHELLFFVGHSGERSKFSFGTLVSRGTPYTTQEIPLPDGWGDKDYHFALPYPGEKIQAVDGGQASVPLPPGFSGSLVWNTRFVELGGVDWNPMDALVTGILWGWPTGATSLLATKIEKIKIH